MERFIIPSAFLGALSGVIFGILLLMPFIAPFIFFLMFILSGIFAVIILKKINAVGVLSVYDGCFIGTIAGFASLVGASVIYLPLAFLLGGYFSLKNYDILAILMLVFSTALLSALFNAFSALVTAYIFEKIETRGKTGFKDHFELNIDKGDEDI